MKPDLLLKLAQPRRTWIPYFILIVSLLLTGITTSYVAMTAKAKDELRFESATQSIQNNIEDRIQTYITLLRGTSGLFAASDNVTRNDFRNYINSLQLRSRYPGVLGIGYSARVTPTAKDALIAEIRKQGVTNFKITPGFQRSEYHTIVYIEPFERRNQAAIGFDMFTEAVRRQAMQRARDTGTSAISGKVTLVQEIDQEKQAGFLIYLPIYRKNAQIETIAQRQAALRGFVYSAFRADDLLRGIVRTDNYPYVDIQVYDGTTINLQNLLHRNNTTSPQPLFTTTKNITVDGRIWTIVFTSGAEFASVSETRLAPSIWLGGLLISFVLFALTRSLANAKVAAERGAAQLRNSQIALRASELRLRRLVDSNIIGIIIADLSGNILEANDAFLQIVGYQRDELDKLQWQEITPPEYRHVDTQALTELKTFGACTPFEKEYIRADGSHVPILLGGAMLEAQQDVCIAFIVDLTQRQQLENALRQQTVELTQANRLKDDFLAIISHELRTPLNSMLGWVQLLRSRKLSPDKTAKALEVIERNAKTQTQLIEDLLDISRLIRGEIRLQMTRVDLVSVLSVVISNVQPLAQAKQIQIISKIGCTEAVVCGEPDRLRQIVGNLLSNAIKFTPEAGEVEIRLSCNRIHASIQVSDTGKGISAEFLPYVFDRFRQAESAITRANGGLGLGLAIVHQLVKLHDGTVSAASLGIGQGATFTITLPLLKSVNQELTALPNLQQLSS